MMLFLGIKDKFMLDNDLQVPYQQAIKTLEKLEMFSTPLDKLSCLTECFGNIKSKVVDYHKGKVSYCYLIKIIYRLN